LIAAYKLIRDRLQPDPFLLGATTGVFMRRARPGQALPFIIIGKQSGLSDHVFQGEFLRNLVYTVKVVYGDETSMETAGAIDDAINTLLTGSPLRSDRHKTIGLQRESDVEYAEDSDGKVYYHEGGLYRLLVTS